jgi:hypothetical protein
MDCCEGIKNIPIHPTRWHDYVDEGPKPDGRSDVLERNLEFELLADERLSRHIN